MGYLGMVGLINGCLDQVESVYAARPIAFRASPYGISHDFGGLNIVPYLIDPTTLKIEWREDLLIGPYSTELTHVATLDDSTMVWHEVGPPSGGSYTSRLRVLTRSGITIAMSGEQQSVVTASPEATVIRLDSTHVLRRYTTPTTFDTVVQVLSVSGGTVSVVASTTYATGAYTVTRDGGEAGSATVGIIADLIPFHYDGASTLFCFGAATGFPFPPRIHAVPFSIGGSISAPGLSWRSRDSQSVISGLHVGKIGSSECLLFSSTTGEMGFYDDGTQMHYLQSTGSAWIVANGFAELDHETSFGDYLTPDVLEYPAGTDVHDGIADLISQSGTSLSYTPIDLRVRCREDGVDISGDHGPTRHDSALGAVSHAFDTLPRLRAFAW